ncbi:MAG: hypothetical protein ACLQMO_00805 [Acidobacteriaceae bacterium]
MNLTPCESALVRLHSASKTQLQAVQHYFARRDLEANLATLLDAARGHEAHSVPAGSPQYLVLHNQSERLVTGYCARWQVTPDQLNAELPALGRLRQLAQPPLRKTPMINIALAFLACMAAAFALGIAAACVRLGYHLIGGAR